MAAEVTKEIELEIAHGLLPNEKEISCGTARGKPTGVVSQRGVGFID